MIVTCDGCHAKYAVDLGKIKNQRAQFTCQVCGKVIVVKDSGYKPDIREEKTNVKSSENVMKATSRIPWIDRIQVRYNAIIAVVIMVILGSYAAIQYHTAENKMNLEMDTSTEILARRLANHLSEPFWALDDEILQESLKSEMLDKKVFAINIIDRDDKTIYMGYKRGDSWEPVKNNQSIEKVFITRKIPITKSEKKIGSVQVYLTAKFKKEELFNFIKAIGITSSILIVVVFLSIYLITKTMIVKPISNLIDLADQISMGILDTEIPSGSKTEIGLLAESLNRLKTSVVIAIDRLKKT